MRNITCNTFVDSYEKVLSDLFYKPEFISHPRDQKIKEILDYTIEIRDPLHGHYWKNEARNLPLKYLSNELILYFSGDNSIEKFGKISNFWKSISDKTVNSAYGNLIFSVKDSSQHISQWEWAKKSLRTDKDSRQAIIHYNRPSHQYFSNKDFVCTMLNQFFIRENKLYLTTYIRSNDFFLGYTYDCVWFMLLMQCMRIELLDIYPNLQLGSYTHHIGSLHIYERNWNILKNMLENEFIEFDIPLIEELPILNENIINMSDCISYVGNDNFFKWLYENKKD